MSLSVQYHERRFALLLLILILTTCISQCLLIFNTKLLFFTLKLITVLIQSYSCFSSNFHPVILGFISKSWLLQLLLQRSHTEKWFTLTVDLFSVCVCVCVCARMHCQSFGRVQLFCNPTDCSPPGSPVHGTSQARILEWVAISYIRESSRPWDWSHVSCISFTGRWILYHCTTWEALFIVENWILFILKCVFKSLYFIYIFIRKKYIHLFYNLITTKRSWVPVNPEGQDCI